ncbi:beta-galactosidase trimerization domain-containing protein [Streptomyces sp. CA-111067]|uniref:glycoside hydrolase 5 family protein n=1 Tax=Streptomyces sp. CA-111067 TaxID=3240046 RepID=UPI003D96F235
MTLRRPTRHLTDDGPWIGANFWSRSGGPLMWRSYDDDVVRQELTVLKEHGLNVVRSFFYWPDFHPAPDTIDETCVERYRMFLRACEDIGIATIPTFIVGHMSGANWDVSWRGGRDIYADGFVLGQQAFFIEQMVRRVGSSPAIAGWLISNEIIWYGGRTTREYARAWGLICTQAVRAGGSQLPVALGDGCGTVENTGDDWGLRMSDQDDISDWTGPHSYPMSDDQTRQMFHAAFLCESSHFGKPVVLEEFGVTSAFVSDEHAADYYRQVLHHTLLAGATGWIAWNNTDFDLLDQDPYRHHLYELNFGITTSAGKPKPPLLELRDFEAVLRAVDFGRCSRADTGTAVLLPSYLSADFPMIDPAERRIIPEIGLHAYIAAKRAGLAPAVVREQDGLPDAGLVLIPSNKALTGTTFQQLPAAAEAGSHLYLSWFSGAGTGQRGAWWPQLEPLFGVRHRLRYGLSEPVADVVTLTVEHGFGDLAAGDRLTVRAAGAEHTRAVLPIDPLDAEVLLTDARGEPALIRRRIGEGALYLATMPIEYFGAVRRDANEDDDVWRLYRALALEAGVAPEVSVDDGRVVCDEVTHAEGTRYVWLVNTTAEAVAARPRLAAGAQLTDVLSGEDLTAKADLAPFGVRVARLGGRS